MALFFSTASLVLFLINADRANPMYDTITGLAVGLGAAGLVLWFAGYVVGRRKD